jgi:cation transport ATPase
METMQKIDHVILDKTGTLTTGLLCVKNIEPSEKWWTEWKTFCLLVCAAEETTAPNHPAAGAVFKSLLQNMVPEWQEYKSRGSLVEFESRPGQGVSALVDLGDGKLPRICVGNARLMDEFGVEITKFILPHEKIGGLKVYVAIDNVYAGVITLGVSYFSVTNSFNHSQFSGHSKTRRRICYKETKS